MGKSDKFLCDKEVQHCGDCPACARNAKNTPDKNGKPIAISSESSLLLDDIEAKIARNEMSASQVFTQMSQLVADGITRGRMNTVKKFNKSDIQVLGNRVLVKQYHVGVGFTWRCIAEFYSHIGLSADPAAQAENYARTITRED